MVLQGRARCYNLCMKGPSHMGGTLEKGLDMCVCVFAAHLTRTKPEAKLFVSLFSLCRLFQASFIDIFLDMRILMPLRSLPLSPNCLDPKLLDLNAKRCKWTFICSACFTKCIFYFTQQQNKLSAGTAVFKIRLYSQKTCSKQ